MGLLALETLIKITLKEEEYMEYPERNVYDGPVSCMSFATRNIEHQGQVGNKMYEQMFVLCGLERN